MYVPRDVVRAQSGKLPEVQTKTAVVLRGHGFEKESNLLAGKQAQTCINVSVVCCTVDSSRKDNLKASIIIVSFKHTMLGHSKWVPEPHCLTTWPRKHLLAHTKPFPRVVVCQQWSEWVAWIGSSLQKTLEGFCEVLPSVTDDLHRYTTLSSASLGGHVNQGANSCLCYVWAGSAYLWPLEWHLPCNCTASDLRVSRDVDFAVFSLPSPARDWWWMSY